VLSSHSESSELEPLWPPAFKSRRPEETGSNPAAGESTLSSLLASWAEEDDII
jgi:hypothetical protein